MADNVSKINQVKHIVKVKRWKVQFWDNMDGCCFGNPGLSGGGDIVRKKEDRFWWLFFLLWGRY